MTTEENRKEIYEYTAPWTIYGLEWTHRANQPFRLALGSFKEEYKNKVQLVQLDFEKGEFITKCTFNHPYPPTKLLSNPDGATGASDTLATTGDFLRLWEVSEDGPVRMVRNFNNKKNLGYCAPLTSMDWSAKDPKIIGTSSIDTTCTIWDIEAGKPITQLIAHDKEVFDLAFLQDDVHRFVSVGADGSMRMFDTRSLEHSTIIYENKHPLLRVEWNKIDANYIATFSEQSQEVTIVDIRLPGIQAATLGGLDGHDAPVNAISWAPYSMCHICTAGDDGRALIWDLSSLPRPVEEPILTYQSSSYVNQMQWSALQPDWIAIAYGSSLQVLRV